MVLIYERGRAGDEEVSTAVAEGTAASGVDGIHQPSGVLRWP